MNLGKIISSCRRRYRSFYLMVAVATAICVAVITGSLIVGDSVRKSLQLRAADRLYGTESVIVCADGFMGTEALQELSLGPESRAVLLSDGFVSYYGKFYPVTVWGMDVLPDGTPIPEGSIAVNEEFARKVGDFTGQDLVLRLPDDGLVPSSSLFVTGRYSTSMRLSFLTAVDAAHGGNLSLKNGQVIPYNVFVSRRELCSVLSLGDKLNVILSPEDIPQERLSSLSAKSMGISYDSGRITSDGVFLKAPLVDKLTGECDNPNRLFSYLVNSIGKDGRSVPYSFATALDFWDGRQVEGAILSDWAAARLGARPGDSVSVSYFVSDELKNLTEKTISLPVSKIVRTADLVRDDHLSADFPGLSDSESCSDWDSDLPIDMSRISDDDENYWSDYRSTPKILLPYSLMRPEWADDWGDATQVRTTSPASVLSAVGADDFPVSVFRPREDALSNAAGGVDFGGLFLALGFLIIFAALLLMYSPLGEMYAARAGEFSLLRAVGYSDRTISRILAREVLPVAAAGTSAGILLALLYAGCIIFLLGNIWSGATHTDGFSLHPGGFAIDAGILSGLLLAAAVVFLAIRNALFRKPSAKGAGKEKTGLLLAIICSVLLVICAAAGFAMKSASVVLFIVTGCLCIAAGLLWTRAILRKKAPAAVTQDAFSRQSLSYSLPEVMTGMVTLALGVFITFAVGLNRKDFSDKRAFDGATGGFDFWCDLTVPLQHDISTPQGRLSLNLQGLGEEAAVMQLSGVGGDDASCLNLNKVTTPAILGFRPEEFLASGFRIKDDIFNLKDESAVLERISRDDAIYCLADETVLMWSLMMAVGDTLHYSGPAGEKLDVIVAGTLPNTVFQGNVLVPADAVRRHWGERGSKVLLVKSPAPDAGDILETALNEYGIRAVPCTERLRVFNSVTDTYLTIFLMLGAIGLVIGIVSFVIGVRKRLARKGTDISLQKALGYSDGAITESLARENSILPASAVALGFISAVVSVMSSFGAISPWTWLVCIITTALCIFIVLFSVRKMARDAVGKTFNS